jgi:hypothetical protein
MRDDEGPTVQRTQRTTPRLKEGGNLKVKGGNIGRMKEENPMLKGGANLLKKGKTKERWGEIIDAILKRKGWPT